MIVAARGPVYSFNGYPVAAVTWAQRNGLLGADSRVVTRDFVGNYLEARYGTSVPVFIDDRYDMFPPALVEDFVTLNDGHAGWEEVLERYHASAVLWPTNEALGQLVADSPRWRIVYSDQEFLIGVPRLTRRTEVAASPGDCATESNLSRGVVPQQRDGGERHTLAISATSNAYSTSEAPRVGRSVPGARSRGTRTLRNVSLAGSSIAPAAYVAPSSRSRFVVLMMTGASGVNSIGPNSPFRSLLARSVSDRHPPEPLQLAVAMQLPERLSLSCSWATRRR